MAIRIITDTSSDYSFEQARAQDMTLVPMTINVGTASYADGIDLTQTDFYDMLLSDGEVPKTSQPTPQDFLEHFERAKANGDEVIAILLSGELSGTMQSALTAREMLGGEGIYVVDSRCASAGIHVLVEEARRMIAEGATAPEIVERLNELKTRIRIYLGLDTLKYLYRGGRLTRMEAGLGTLASLHPLLALRDGTLEVCAKCMGGKKALRKLTEIVAGTPRDEAFPMRFIYSYNDANCRALMAQFPGAEACEVVALGPTLAAHAGPGVYGAVLVEKKP